MADRYTDGTYAAAHPDWHADDAPHKARAVLDLLAALGWAPATVIDVGCGTGDVLGHLVQAWQAQGRTVHAEGWDIAAAPLRTPPPGVTLHRGDACQQAEPAELVLCLDVVEHQADDVAFLRRLRRLGPRVLLRVPLELSVLDVLRPHRMLDARHTYGHLHAYTRATALARIQQAGFTVVADRYDRVPPHSRTPRQHLMQALRRLTHRLHPHAAVLALGGWSLLVAALPGDDHVTDDVRPTTA